MHELDREFELFSRSVDIVDDSTFKEFKGFLRSFIEKRLGADTFEVLLDGHMIPGETRNTPALKTAFAKYSNNDLTVSLDDSVGPYCHVSYAYVNNVGLWVVPKDRKSKLEGCGPFVDHWSSRGDDLPSYMFVPDESSLQTSVIVPLRYRGSPFGVINIEFKDRLDYSESNKNAVERIADGVARVMWLNRNYSEQTKNTANVLDEMKSMVNKMGGGGLRRPVVFVAYAENARGEVKAALSEVAREFEHELEFQWWDTFTKSGEITKEIREAIRNSAFGICYLSEPTDTDGAPLSFQDNPNVLFEAGMLQMLSATTQNAPTRWIPIRESEESAGPTPFDFRNERILTVPRGRDGFAKPEFLEQLRARISNMIS